MEVIKEVNLIRCYHKCEFFNISSDGMECKHPYFEDKGVYDNMIITQDNSKNEVPLECPFRKDPILNIQIIVKIGN